jgi:hypothetical protein
MKKKLSKIKEQKSYNSSKSIQDSHNDKLFQQTEYLVYFNQTVIL